MKPVLTIEKIILKAIVLKAKDVMVLNRGKREKELVGLPLLSQAKYLRL